MKSTPKWLLIPPVVALLLVLGPMAMQQNDAKDGKQPASTAVADAAPRTALPNEATPPRGGKTTGLVPRTPDMWQVGTTLIGVILLGVGGMLALKKLRGGATPSSRTPVASLRQTLRLLAPDGVLIFSTNHRAFRLDRDALADLRIEDWSRRTLPPDFARQPKIHHCWRIARR